MLGLFQLVCVTFLGFAGSAAIVAAVVHRASLRRLSRVGPRSRARLLTMAALAPMVGGAALTFLCLLPSVLGAAFPVLDHCPHHGSGHPHLCLVHPPASTGSLSVWLGAIGMLAVFLVPVLRDAARAWRTRRCVGQLLATALPGPAHDVLLIESDEPIALAAGLLRPRILVSRGLVARLDPAALDAVLAHERAHHRRRDGVRKLLAQVGLAFHLPGIRRSLAADLDLAIEQASDEEAATTVGDRLLVARALLAVERLLQGRASSAALLGVAIGGAALSRRVGALVSGLVEDRPQRGSMRVAVAISFALLLLADPLHHAAETALGLLAR